MAEVRAELVGNVWKVLVSEGDHVDDGDALGRLVLPKAG